MKKAALFLLVLILVAMASVAMALSVTATYSDGELTYTVSGVSFPLEVWLDKKNTGRGVLRDGTYTLKIDLEPGDHVLNVASDIGGKARVTFTVYESGKATPKPSKPTATPSGGSKVTAAPTETPAPVEQKLVEVSYVQGRVNVQTSGFLGLCSISIDGKDTHRVLDDNGKAVFSKSMNEATHTLTVTEISTGNTAEVEFVVSHDVKLVEVNSPSCDADGLYEVRCMNCDADYGTIIRSMLPHLYVWDYDKATKAWINKCELCGKVNTHTSEGPDASAVISTSLQPGGVLASDVIDSAKEGERLLVINLKDDQRAVWYITADHLVVGYIEIYKITAPENSVIVDVHFCKSIAVSDISIKAFCSLDDYVSDSGLPIEQGKPTAFECDNLIMTIAGSIVFDRSYYPVWEPSEKELVEMMDMLR